MSTHRLNLHLVSDATGETLNSIVRATTVQFEHLTILPHRWSLIRTRFQLHRVIDGLQAEPGPVLSSLVVIGAYLWFGVIGHGYQDMLRPVPTSASSLTSTGTEITVEPREIR